MGKRRRQEEGQGAQLEDAHLSVHFIRANKHMCRVGLLLTVRHDHELFAVPDQAKALTLLHDEHSRVVWACDGCLSPLIHAVQRKHIVSHMQLRPGSDIRGPNK